MKVSRQILGDDDAMPFGKYKGVRMKSVPAQYLWWFIENGKAVEGTPFGDYCERHRESIEAEVKAARGQRGTGPFDEDPDDDSGFDVGLPGDPADYGDN